MPITDTADVASSVFPASYIVTDLPILSDAKHSCYLEGFSLPGTS